MGQGEAQLLLNGQTLERSQIVGRNISTYTFRVDPFANSVGQSLRSIALALKGRFYIGTVTFNLLQIEDRRPDPFPIPLPTNEIVRQQVNERIMGEGGLELFRLFGLGMSRQGQVIKKVTITGRSDRGLGMAELQINGQSVGVRQTISDRDSIISFDMPAGLRIGQELRMLQVRMVGFLNISEVSVEIETGIVVPEVIFEVVVVVVVAGLAVVFRVDIPIVR
jgi:hypothetical protein